jgi:phage terminase Nu1 subunit (DNA packaging protein)
MPTESGDLTRQRVRKEKAMSGLRELQLAETAGLLVRAHEVEEAWSAIVVRFRSAVMQIPSRCAAKFPDPHFAEAVIRAECELALRSLAKRE